MMIINTLNGVQSNAYIQQSIIQEELQKLGNFFQKKKLDFEDMKFPIKIRDIYKIENKENKKNYSIDVSKKML